MPRSSERSLPRLLSLTLGLGGLALGLLSYLTWDWKIAGHVRGLAEYFFERQDMWVLDGYAAALILMAGWAWTLRPASRQLRQDADGQIPLVLIGIGLVVLVAWWGRSLVFHGYSASRDEVMVELAGAYLADGHLGRAIPPEWHAYARALMPEFYSPYGADRYWTAVYLPVHAAIRALFLKLGDADLAAPVTLGIGLLALWRTARRLMPDRPGGVAVTMIMALSSAQLVTTAMTPYAMTSHFAFDMVWLLLVLRGGRLDHLLAGLVALLAAGLHQWHFPLLFIGPFILWLLARRQWRAALFHCLVCVAMMLVWARLWPMLLTHELGPPPLSDVHRTNGIFDKLESLFGRLDGWLPMLDNARLIAWNNLLLLPLALVSVLAIRWRSLFRDPPVILPLLLVVAIGMGLAIYQGYGWGFRYMAGGVGALCLLAGIGWTALVRSGDRAAFRLVALSGLLSLLAGLWLLVDTEHYVRGYARSMEAIEKAPADVVLVDIRGGFYLTDLVRFDHGRLGRPAVMALHMLSYPQLDRLCATKRVMIADASLYRAAGLHAIAPVFLGSQFIQQRRNHLADIGCGALVTLH